MKKNRLASLDALRAFAALAVVLYHSEALVTGIVFFDAVFGFLKKNGWMGVHVFFVLSGFCIHMACSQSAEPFNLRRYFYDRWRRIYPPYFFALVFSISFVAFKSFYFLSQGLDPHFEYWNYKKIAAHLLLVNNMWPFVPEGINAVFWTIAIEAQIYLIYPFVRKPLLKKPVWVVLIGLTAYVLAHRCHFLPGGVEILHVFKYWIEWLLGALAYSLYARNKIVPKKRLALLSFILLFAAAWILMLRLDIYIVGNLFYMLSSVALLFLFIWSESSWLDRRWRWVPFLGGFSYSIYLIHLPVLQLFQDFVGSGHFFAGIAAAIGLSYFFYIFFEKPFLKRPVAGAPSIGLQVK